MFKKLILGLILSTSMFVSGLAYADTNVTVAWTPNVETDLAGYKLYMGNVSGIYTTIIDVGNVSSYNVTSPDGVTFYALTAYDTSNNESGYSTEVMSLTDSTSPGNPINVTVTIN